MRIDYENKIVWCDEECMKWYVSFYSSHGDNLCSILKLIEVLSAERELVLPRPMDRNYRIKLIKAIASDYEFKLEKHKKYYWRKKKVHLANFEIESGVYFLNSNGDDCFLNDAIEYDGLRTKFTVEEAKEILIEDFYMFECVEVD